MQISCARTHTHSFDFRHANRKWWTVNTARLIHVFAVFTCLQHFEQINAHLHVIGHIIFAAIWLPGCQRLRRISNAIYTLAFGFPRCAQRFYQFHIGFTWVKWIEREENAPGWAHPNSNYIKWPLSSFFLQKFNTNRRHSNWNWTGSIKTLNIEATSIMVFHIPSWDDVKRDQTQWSWTQEILILFEMTAKTLEALSKQSTVH